jgi:hypothetical protein
VTVLFQRGLAVPMLAVPMFGVLRFSVLMFAGPMLGVLRFSVLMLGVPWLSRRVRSCGRMVRVGMFRAGFVVRVAVGVVCAAVGVCVGRRFV